VVDPETALGLAVRPGPFVRLVMRDTGTAIPADALTHVFEPFHSTGRGGRGSGLGLTKVYALVSQYGGCVTAASEPGDTAFEVLLPAAR
jgi:C4-dicarboxylate-specific signal transduction histidine kinase